MKQNNTIRLRALAMSILLLSIMLIQCGCSGCSPSGRRSKQKARSHNTQSESVARNTNRSSSSNSTSRNTHSSNNQELTLNELYNKYRNSVFLIYTSDGSSGYQGSGFFVSKQGIAISNYHVFEGTSTGLEIIETLDGEQFKIQEVLDRSKENDFIIFKVKIGSYEIINPIPIITQSTQIGEDVFAIGNPRGLESTLSKGIVSSFRENNRLIQTTTEITHGSSGGPLLNMNGEVIGITSMGLGEANLNFAINIKTLNLHRYIDL